MAVASLYASPSSPQNRVAPSDKKATQVIGTAKCSQRFSIASSDWSDPALGTKAPGGESRAEKNCPSPTKTLSKTVRPKMTKATPETSPGWADEMHWDPNSPKLRSATTKWLIRIASLLAGHQVCAKVPRRGGLD